MAVGGVIKSDGGDTTATSINTIPTTDDEEVIDNIDTEVPSKRRLKRIAKAQANVGWKQAVQNFKDSCLDDSYIFYAVRNTLIQGAKQYPPSSPDAKTLLPGTHKHLGGAYDPVSGVIFGIPANGASIMAITPNRETGEYELGTIPLPEHIARRQMKWLRGIVDDKYLWAIPSWANAVLCVDLEVWREQQQQQQQTTTSHANNEDVTRDMVKLIPLPESHPKEMRWQWHGGALNDEKTAIYCVPSNAKHVLKIDVRNMTTSFIDIQFDEDKYPDFTLDCTNKWYGGIIGDDNCIYGSPYRGK